MSATRHEYGVDVLWQRATDEAFTDNPVILDTAQPEYQIRDALQTGAWRFWRVRVIDEDTWIALAGGV